MFFNSSQPYSNIVVKTHRKDSRGNRLDLALGPSGYLDISFTYRSPWHFSAPQNITYLWSVRLDQVPSRHDNRRVHCRWDHVPTDALGPLGRAVHSLHWPWSKFVERRCHWQRGHWSTSKPGHYWAMLTPNVPPMALQNHWILGLSLHHVTKSNIS